MNLILEITRPDGSVVIQPVDKSLSKVDAQPGDHFRLIDSATGQAPADMTAHRDGESLIIEGLPELSALELCDFYKRDGDDSACILAMPGEDVVAPTSAPVMLAQTPTAAPQDAGKKEATTATKDAAAASSTDAAAAAGSSDAAAAAATNPAFSASTVALGTVGLVGVGVAVSNDSDDPAAPAPPPPAPPPPAPPPPAPPPPAPAAPTGVTSEGADDIIGVGERLPVGSGGNTGETGNIDFTGAAGSVEAGATVTLDLRDSGGTSILAAPITTSALSDGSFTVGVPAAEAITLGSGVYTPVVTQTTANGTSAAATMTDITILPTSPSSISIEGGDSTVTSAEAAGGVDITGVTEPGATVQVILWDTGFTTQYASVTSAAADGSGNFSVSIPSGSLPANGSYVLQSTTTSNGLVSDFPNTTGVTLQLDLNATAGQTLAGGSATGINGNAGGNEVLLGDFGGNIRNGSFEFWDTTDVATEFDASGFSANGAVSANLGWTIAAGTAAPLDPDSVPGIAAGSGGGGTQDYFNHSAGTGAPPGDPLDRRVQFDTASTVGSGVQDWDTVSDNFYAGGGLTQNVTTVTGQVYTLRVSADKATGDVAGGNFQDTMMQVSWDGSIIATRNPDGSWTGSNVPTIDTSPATEVHWDFTLPAASGGTSALIINAFDRHFDGTGGGTGDGGDNQGVIITNVSMSGGASGDDTISGDAGADLIWGQGGNDTLYGGVNGANDTDADRFVYSMQMDNGNDVIMDFDAANGDRVQLVDVMNVFGAATTQADGATSDSALTFDDLMVNGTQEIVVSDASSVSATYAGQVLLTFSDASGSLGQVVLNGATFGAGGAGQYDSVQDLLTGNGGDIILQMTGDGFHTGL